MKSKSLVIAKDNPVWYGFPLVIAALYLFHFTNQNNDFAVFMKAGEYFLQRVDPWSQFDNPASMYLNGPTTLPLMSIFSLLPFAVAITLLRVLNLAITFIVISKEFGLHNARNSSAFISLIFLSSPFRSSMEYGQFTILFGVLGFVLLKRLLQNQGSDFYTGLSLLLVIEYKPNIFGMLLVIAVIKTRLKVLSFTILLFAISEIFLKTWLGQLPLLSWFNAIEYRSLYAATGEDNLSFIPELKISVVLILLVCLALFVYFNNSSRNLSLELSVALLSVFLLITPLLHPTDFLILALLLLTRKELNLTSSLLFGLLMVWSPTMNGLMFAVIAGSASIFIMISQKRVLLKHLICFNVPNAIYIALVRFGFFEPSIRHFLQLAFIAIFAITGLASLRKLHHRI